MVARASFGERLQANTDTHVGLATTALWTSTRGTPVDTADSIDALKLAWIQKVGDCFMFF